MSNQGCQTGACDSCQLTTRIPFDHSARTPGLISLGTFYLDAAPAGSGAGISLNRQITGMLRTLHFWTVGHARVEIETIAWTKRKFTIATDVIRLSVHHIYELFTRMLPELEPRFFPID